MKKRRDITLGEMQDECSFRGHNCETVGGEPCEYYGICNQIRTKSCTPPEDWDLSDPQRFTEQQMALLRMMMENKAEYATQRNGAVGFYTAAPMYCVAVVYQQILNDGEIVYLAELLGKDGADANK